LRLEITESSVSVDPDAAVIHLQRLSDIGVGVSLDNFGAGMASMNYLMRLPIQLLKLDRRLTAFLPAKGRQGAMIETIFGLGRALQVRMQADGIENEMQLKELKRYGCELGQGMLLAGPLPAADAAVFLDGNCRPVPMS
jgi:EAL domain-containing protein (putative c-di-GMP-specific phosphodiesterase class I)